MHHPCKVGEYTNENLDTEPAPETPTRSRRRGYRKSSPRVRLSEPKLCCIRNNRFFHTPGAK